MKNISFVLLVFYLFFSPLATAEDAILTASQLQKYLSAMPEIQRRYSNYEGLLGENGEQASANLDIEHQVKVLKVHGLHQEFTNQVAKSGFSSAEDFLTVQLRIALAMGRLSMERLYAKSFEQIRKEQMAALTSIPGLRDDAEASANLFTEIAAMTAAMSKVSKDELDLIQEYETQLGPFFYSPEFLPPRR